MTDVSVDNQTPPTIEVGPRQITLLIVDFLLAVAVVVGIAAYTRHQASTDAAAHNAAYTSANKHTPRTPLAMNGGDASVPDTSGAPYTANSTQNTSNDACAHLTLTTARQLLGDSAQKATPHSTSGLQAAGTTLASCAYSGQTGTIQLTLRTAHSSLGASQNATAFGSEKPADSTNVSGYGQAAYWNPSNNTLNVLGHNNWYIITGTQPTQESAQTVADQLKAGF